ncbi:hypothetical protein [Terriglobus albidus]|uniref:hypothetical protein n=1 Tax=Terriglobus albidus TaxID=1592106 RepID=UPI001FEC389E|nr:hypothetical protein [Terriglobus albidus]
MKQTLMAIVLAAAAAAAPAAQLSSDAKSAIPRDVQQIITVDYRAMQNSSAAMALKDRVLPPELKRLESALKSSGLKVDQDADNLAFVAYRTGEGSSTNIIGIAQGQFRTRDILAYFTKNKIKPTMLRNNAIYPMGAQGMSVVWLNQTTMVFGDKNAVRTSMEARDGNIPNFLNGDLASEMPNVDDKAVWSLLDQKGTQTMMKSVMGDASQLADYDTVRNRMKSSRYTMDFANGVKFDMSVVTSDTVTAATIASLMKAVSMYKQNSGSTDEKQALDHTTISSSSGTITVAYASSDSQFASLLSSSLFQQVVR